MMNYRTVLRDFSPVEWGDFLMRFEINRRSYVLFSPEQDRTVLRDFSPVEWGDFLMRFEINRRSYVLFSPEQGRVSCLELMYFTELDPLQLSVLLGIKVESESMDEFVFRATCSRDRLIDYLFDVKAGGGSVKQKHVSGWKAYLMTDVVREDKVRNICQFNIETKESKLAFDNRCCAAARPVSVPVRQGSSSTSAGIRPSSLP